MRLSVVIVCRGDNAAVEASLESVLAQQVDECEVILAGGSVKKLATRFASRGAIRGIDANGSVGAVRNEALAHAGKV